MRIVSTLSSTGNPAVPIRSVGAIHAMSVQRHGDSLRTEELPESLGESRTGPFLMVSLFAMREGVFPPHPHAGFSVATYMLPESPSAFVNQDSLGNHHRIAPGSLHVTVAGSGVLHEEQPEHSGALARGFQIWIDHSDGDREVAPSAHHLDVAAVPVVDHDGARVRVLLGGFGPLRSPLALPTPVRLLDLALAQGATLELPLDAAEQSFIIVHAGALKLDDHRVDASTVVLITDAADCVTLTAQLPGTRATLFSGRQVTTPRLRHGPFVASSAEQLQRFLRRLQRGEFGSLPPFSQRR